MIVTIIIVSLALGWLGRETDWLRVRLLVGSGIAIDDLIIDIENEFDGSDADFSMDYDLQLKEAKQEIDYQEWLNKRYAPKYKYGSPRENTIDPRDKWMVIEDDLRARRNKEMIYQR